MCRSSDLPWSLELKPLRGDATRIWNDPLMIPSALRVVSADRIEEGPTNEWLGNDVIKAGCGGTLSQHGVMKARDHDRMP